MTKNQEMCAAAHFWAHHIGGPCCTRCDWPPPKYEPVYETLARETKAAKLAVAILRAMPNFPEDAYTVRGMVASQMVRRRAEHAAKVNNSSDKTWARVAELLTGEEHR